MRLRLFVTVTVTELTVSVSVTGCLHFISTSFYTRLMNGHSIDKLSSVSFLQRGRAADRILRKGRFSDCLQLRVARIQCNNFALRTTSLLEQFIRKLTCK